MFGLKNFLFRRVAVPVGCVMYATVGVYRSVVRNAEIAVPAAHRILKAHDIYRHFRADVYFISSALIKAYRRVCALRARFVEIKRAFFKQADCVFLVNVIDMNTVARRGHGYVSFTTLRGVANAYVRGTNRLRGQGTLTDKATAGIGVVAVNI